MLFIENDYLGELAALIAALLWAVSSVVYSRVGLKIPPLQLNFYKGIIAIALIVVTLILQGMTFRDISWFNLVLLAFSGVIGIGLGDTAYFSALNSLGARRTLLLETASPPIGGLLAFLFIGETLSYLAWCGILLTGIGIAWVISERNPSNNLTVSPMGIMWGILAAIAQALGAVISRFALINSDIDPLSSTLIRLIGGLIIVALLLCFNRDRQPIKVTQKQLISSFGIIAAAATMGTYLGIWLQQVSLKFAPTGIAQTFLATSPLFILPIVALQGEKISWRAILGAINSLSGIALMFVR